MSFRIRIKKCLKNMFGMHLSVLLAIEILFPVTQGHCLSAHYSPDGFVFTNPKPPFAPRRPHLWGTVHTSIFQVPFDFMQQKRGRCACFQSALGSVVLLLLFFVGRAQRLHCCLAQFVGILLGALLFFWFWCWLLLKRAPTERPCLAGQFYAPAKQSGKTDGQLPPWQLDIAKKGQKALKDSY